MKTIGLLGGMSWESTVTYYQLLNRMARERLGGLHSAKTVLWSFDFAEIERYQATGDWQAAADRMVDAARRVEAVGADCLLICTNTMHRMAPEVAEAIDIPLIHIADATAAAVKQTAVQRPLLLATRYTMEQYFYKGHLQHRYGIEVAVPDDSQRTVVHDIIYSELCRGIVTTESKHAVLNIVNSAIRRDAIDGVIFGCTEVGLLISDRDFDVLTFDSTDLHAKAALNFALSER